MWRGAVPCSGVLYLMGEVLYLVVGVLYLVVGVLYLAADCTRAGHAVAFAPVQARIGRAYLCLQRRARAASADTLGASAGVGLRVRYLAHQPRAGVRSAHLGLTLWATRSALPG